MAVASCPKCKTKIAVVPGEQPVCPGCGAKFKMPAAKPEPVAAAAGHHSPADDVPPFQIRTAPEEPPIIPEPIISAETVTVAKASTPTDQPSPNAYESPAAVETWKPKFEPRKYPAMRRLIYVLNIFTVIAIVGLVITLLALAVIVFSAFTANQSSIGAAEAIFTFGVSLLFSLAGQAIVIVLFKAAAEAIRVLLDIQENTQEAAFNSRGRQ